VTDKEGHTLWLMGSIHVGREDFYPLPDSVLEAYRSSDALAVEVDVIAAQENMMGLSQAMMTMMYTDGTTISDHIPEELYNNAVQVMQEYNLYYSLMDYFNPGFWSDLISSAVGNEAGDSALGIDMFFLTDAKENGKEIREIETMTSQLTMSTGFSQELQLLLLEQAVEEAGKLEEYKTELIELMDLWASGDEEAFNAYLNEAPEFESDEEAALYAEYNDAMITSRNEKMTQYAKDALASGEEVFICVGAAHVLGSTGMVQQLRELGYTVTLVK